MRIDSNKARAETPKKLEKDLNKAIASYSYKAGDSNRVREKNLTKLEQETHLRLETLTKIEKRV